MSSIGTKLDANQVLKQAYDEPANRIRVDAIVSASIGSVTIIDSDGDELDVNPDGSINVAITTPIAVEIDAADGDNIAVHDSDGDELEINTDGSINVQFTLPGTPVIANIAVPAANTEQSYALPANTKRYMLRARGNARIQLAYVALQSGTNFMTVAPGNVYEIDNVSTSVTIYFQLNKSSETLEVESWS